MNSQPKLRPEIEQRLTLPKYTFVWTTVHIAFVNEGWKDERDYWDYALGLCDSWAVMSRAPAREVEKTVSEVAELARTLANKIRTYTPEIKTLKGYLDIDLHTFIAEDLIRFADGLDNANLPTEAMKSRPRGMSLKTAERTYMARALTHFLLSHAKISGTQIRGRDSIVAMTVCALLNIGSNDEFDAKDVSDLTKDIVAHDNDQDEIRRPASIILSI